jgi:hypothetical protein
VFQQQQLQSISANNNWGGLMPPLYLKNNSILLFNGSDNLSITQIFLSYIALQNPAIIHTLLEVHKRDIMKELHKRNSAVQKLIEPNERERALLCSHKGSLSSPSLDFIDTSAESISEDMVLDYLAQIIISLHESTLCKKSNPNTVLYTAEFPPKNKLKKEIA